MLLEDLIYLLVFLKKKPWEDIGFQKWHKKVSSLPLPTQFLKSYPKMLSVQEPGFMVVVEAISKIKLTTHLYSLVFSELFPNIA